MIDLEIAKEGTVQLTTVSGVLAGIAFATAMGFLTADKRGFLDRALAIGYLIAAVSLLASAFISALDVLATAIALRNPKMLELPAVIDRTALWSGLLLCVGLVAMIVGLGVAGFKINRWVGVFGATFAVLALALCALVFHRIDLAADEHAPSSNPPPRAGHN